MASIIGVETLQHTNGTTAATIDSSGIVTMPTGIKLGTGTDILNLYDEGTWTVENRSIASLTITNTQQAYYVRIGGLVFINFYITYPSTSDSNSAKISLPFTSTGHSYLTGRTQFSGGDDGVVLQCMNGMSEALFYRNESSVSAFTNANLSGQYILMSGCFYTTA